MPEAALCTRYSVHAGVISAGSAAGNEQVVIVFRDVSAGSLADVVLASLSFDVACLASSLPFDEMPKAVQLGHQDAAEAISRC